MAQLKNKKLIALALIFCNMLIAMEHQQEPHLVVIPGQNGAGGQNIPQILPHYTKTVSVKTPLRFPDFGQNRCLHNLDEALRPIFAQTSDPVILHASSQGTATALNYFAQQKEIIDRSTKKAKASIFGTASEAAIISSNLQKIKALILESVMLTGNSAVTHTVTNCMVPEASYFPFHYYWLPYCAKLSSCWFYAPAGRQAIFSVDHLPQSLPVIILHAPQDPQLSYADSEALCAYLTKKGNQNVYLIPVPYGYHVNMLADDSPETKVLQAILCKYDLLPNVSNEDKQELSLVDLKQYQSSQVTQIFQHLPHFNALKSKEEKMVHVDKCVKAAVLSFIVYMLYTKYILDIFIVQ